VRPAPAGCTVVKLTHCSSVVASQQQLSPGYISLPPYLLVFLLSPPSLFLYVQIEVLLLLHGGHSLVGVPACCACPALASLFVNASQYASPCRGDQQGSGTWDLGLSACKSEEKNSSCPLIRSHSMVGTNGTRNDLLITVTPWKALGDSDCWSPACMACPNPSTQQTRQSLYQSWQPAPMVSVAAACHSVAAACQSQRDQGCDSVTRVVGCPEDSVTRVVGCPVALVRSGALLLLYGLNSQLDPAATRGSCSSLVLASLVLPP